MAGWLLVAALVQGGSGGVNGPGHGAAPYVLLISLDGFRHDYLGRGLTPNLEALGERGVRADALVPVFPTKTYTNHYSIATGLYPERHGIVGNEFYDPSWRATFRMSDRATVEDGRWYGGEPIWVTAERQGMVTAAMFFIGTEAPVQGIQPTYWNRYDHTIPIETRLNSVLGWLALPLERRPHLITLYFPMTDDAGHRGGPDSAELNASIAQMDRVLGRLFDEIAALPHGDRVHVVIVSDHGMTPSNRGTIILDDHADLNGIVVVAATTLASLFFEGDTLRRTAVARTFERVPGLRVYTRETIPDEWRIKTHPRAGDLLLVADEGWVLRRRNSRPESGVATHGWAPSPSMHGIFLAAGPRVRAGVRVPAFENVHIYPFLAALLGLRANTDIDGRLEVLSSALRGGG